MINAKTLKLMKSNSVIINTSRGPIIDEQALISALRDEKISAACLDVFEIEPVERDNPLLKMDNVIVMPHSASYSDVAFLNLKKSVINEAIRIYHGKKPINIVNKDAVAKVALT